jgi:endoglucanase
MRRLIVNLTVSRLPALWLAGFALGALLAFMPVQAEDSAGFRRGIGVGHAMGWAAVEPRPSRSFVFPAFAESARNLGTELKGLRRAGFDFVRLAVDPGPFLQFQGLRRDRLDDLLMDRVKLFLSSGLGVIVDFHPSDIHPDYLAEALTRGVDTPLFQSYVRMLVRTAGLLERLQSRNVALEIVNEPPVAPARWQPMLEAAYKAVRERAPRLTLVLDGGDEGGIDGLLTLGAFAKDPAALLSFHYYDPYQFTHQGAPWVDARYLADVPWVYRGSGGFALVRDEASAELDPAVIQALGLAGQ